MRQFSPIKRFFQSYRRCSEKFAITYIPFVNFNSRKEMDTTHPTTKSDTAQSKSQPESLDSYKKAFLETINDKEQYLLHNLDRIREYVLSEFENKRKTALEDLDKFKETGHEADLRSNVLNVVLPFTDFTRHMQDKLSNVLHSKQFFLNVTTDMINATKMTEDETKVAKENFNIVCNYKKRREDNLSCEDLYNEALVKYLVAKTFKKSATDTYNLASCFPIQKYFSNKQALKIACIGGGPGSDLTGLINYLVECGYTTLDCTIYDYNSKNWQSVCKEPLMDIIKKQAVKVFKIPLNISINWQFVDMKQDWPEKEQVPKADVFSTCWALNECFFNTGFWDKIISANPESFLFFVDGESEPINRFQHLETLKGRKFIFEDLENPRRLAIFPSKA